MAGICEAGHRSTTDDYCDVCGLPVQVAPSAPPVGRAPVPASQTCPHCHATNPGDALFCEACGYDYTTGTLPRADAAGMLGLRPMTEEEPVSEPNSTPQPAPATDWLGDGTVVPPVVNAPMEAAQPPPAPPAPVVPQPQQPAIPPGPSPVGPPVGDFPVPDDAEVLPVPAPGEEDSAGVNSGSGEAASAETAGPAAPDAGLDDAPTAGRPAPRAEAYVAEVWIDPDWYEVQQSPDPMPSVGLPTIFRLGTDNLVGRLSRSRNSYPQVDCGTDSGCSRAQARIITDGSRWYVEDLNSANGTYIAASAGPLPTVPITGRTEFGSDDRIYVGAWTRIVVRKASPEELDSLG